MMRTPFGVARQDQGEEMRIALLSDIHGNREAFSAVLADAKLRGIDRFILLGDIVGYGPDPEFCVDQVAALVEAGAIAIKGNHDSAISNPSESMNTVARVAIDWTRPRLDRAQTQFLEDLPYTYTEGGALFVHASANEPSQWHYVTNDRRAIASFKATDARFIFCGHVHVPALMTYDLGATVREHKIPQGSAIPLISSRRWLAVIGSIGQPRDGVPQAAYAILDMSKQDLTFRRVPYDVTTTIEKLRAAKLPEPLAKRLSEGR